jgi:hypothetical protein
VTPAPSNTFYTSSSCFVLLGLYDNWSFFNHLRQTTFYILRWSNIELYLPYLHHYLDFFFSRQEENFLCLAIKHQPVSGCHWSSNCRRIHIAKTRPLLDRLLPYVGRNLHGEIHFNRTRFKPVLIPLIWPFIRSYTKAQKPDQVVVPERNPPSSVSISHGQ